MIICDKHIEYASIKRMRDIMVSIPDQDEVTHTYAMFTTILCWTVQRLRSGPNCKDAMGKKAHELWKTLERESIEDSPWCIRTSAFVMDDKVRDISHTKSFPEFKGFKVSKFLTVLRNSVAHGDGRNIRPINIKIKGKQYLNSYEFTCTDKKNKCDKNSHKPAQKLDIDAPWAGKIELTRADMRDLGREVADRFCNALAADDEEFVRYANQIGERGRAA